MAFIINNATFGDNGLQLGAEQFVRFLPFGPVWNKIRIVLLYSFSSAPADNDPGCYLGVCKNGLALYDSNCIDAVYIGLGVNRAWGVGVSNPYPYVYQNLGSSGYNGTFQRVNGTSTMLGTSTYGTFYASHTLAFRSILVMDITKPTTATQITTTSTGRNDITPQTRATAIAAAENEAAPGTTTTQQYSASYNLIRTDRDWNCVFIAGTRCVPSINIYSVTISRFL